ncbi:HupE/UreJ family protein [Candidatus Sumerlaeota bacterium]|nr:HupE/UreJ family protein [Candidatus Sumerlaeota bacterium]
MTVLLVTFIPAILCAHDVGLYQADVIFAADGTYEIRIKCDLDAALAGAKPGHMTPEQEAKAKSAALLMDSTTRDQTVSFIETHTMPTFDGNEDHPDIELPKEEAGMIDESKEGVSFDAKRRSILMKGRIPEGAKTFTWKSTGFGDASISISRFNDPDVFREPVVDGQFSTPYSLVAPEQNPGMLRTAGKFFLLGFHHIVALDGLDHILFILGLFLLSTHFKPLFWQITSFTIAHSITLSLSVFHVFRLPSGIVESLIALSIAYVAVENLMTQQLKWWRPVVVFCFGLMHGLGFAAGLEEAGIPKNALINALFNFNVGVEVGHLTVVGVAFLIVGKFQKAPWYRKYVVIPGSSIIALMALFWFVQRTIELF